MALTSGVCEPVWLGVAMAGLMEGYGLRCQCAALF